MGSTWRRKTQFTKAVAVSTAEGIEGNGMKCPILVHLSMTTRMQVKPSDFGRSVMKSMEMEDQGLLLIGKGCKKP